MLKNLFGIEPEFNADNSPEDNTDITSSLLLFYSIEEADEFKKLCKIGIKKEYGLRYREIGNVSDFLLKILRKLYAEDNSKENNV